MIGPSSSHTAGAARLAKVAKDVVDAEFHKSNLLLTWLFWKNF